MNDLERAALVFKHRQYVGLAVFHDQVSSDTQDSLSLMKKYAAKHLPYHVVISLDRFAWTGLRYDTQDRRIRATIKRLSLRGKFAYHFEDSPDSDCGDEIGHHFYASDENELVLFVLGLQHSEEI
jgi:hypothetical protein